MAWAWHDAAAPSAPFNAPAKDPNYTYKDVIILMSDGLNTQNRWYRQRQPSRQIDARQKILCDNIKAAKASSRSTRSRSTPTATRPPPSCSIAPAARTSSST